MCPPSDSIVSVAARYHNAADPAGRSAARLQILSLERVPLSANALPRLKAIPGLKKLELTGCGFLDEEVADLVKSRPGLRIER